MSPKLPQQPKRLIYNAIPLFPQSPLQARSTVTFSLIYRFLSCGFRLLPLEHVLDFWRKSASAPGSEHKHETYLLHSMGTGNVPSSHARKQSTCSEMSHPSMPFLHTACVSSSYEKSSSWARRGESPPRARLLYPEHSVVWPKEERIQTKGGLGWRAVANRGW